LSDAEFWKNLISLSRQFAAIASCRFKFHKRSQLFLRSHNEALPVAAMCISHEDGSPVTIHGCDTAPTETGFAEIVSDDFPGLHKARSAT
jgi:hypothetical protein